MQAGILDQVEPKNNKNTILKEKKAKKEEEKETSRYKKNKRKRDIERSNGKDRTREDKYTEENNSGSIVEQ